MVLTSIVAGVMRYFSMRRIFNFPISVLAERYASPPRLSRQERTVYDVYSKYPRLDSTVRFSGVNKRLHKLPYAEWESDYLQAIVDNQSAM